jgi:hypothetical protein
MKVRVKKEYEIDIEGSEFGYILLANEAVKEENGGEEGIDELDAGDATGGLVELAELNEGSGSFVLGPLGEDVIYKEQFHYEDQECKVVVTATTYIFKYEGEWS